MTGNRINETKHANMTSVARFSTYTAVPHDKTLALRDVIDHVSHHVMHDVTHSQNQVTDHVTDDVTHS